MRPSRVHKMRVLNIQNIVNNKMLHSISSTRGLLTGNYFNTIFLHR